MIRLARISALAALMALPMAAYADGAECAEVAKALGKIADKAPDLEKDGIKPRMAVVRIGNAAGLAFAYARDAGWSEDELAPIAAIRDLREPDADGKTLPKEEVPALLAAHLDALLPVMAEKCPETERPDLSGIMSD